MESSSQHNKSTKDDEKHGGRPQAQGMEADTGKTEREQEHGKEMSEHHSSHHDQSSNHNHGHGHGHDHGHREEHVGGGREVGDELVDYLDMGGMTGAAFLEIRYRKLTGRPHDKVERLISSEQMAKQQQSEEEAEAGGREENKGVIYEF